MSLGYAILGNRLAGLLEAKGLDPALGLYHLCRPGRAALALDVLDEFRHPFVDRFVLRICNLGMIDPSSFEADPARPGGLRMTRSGMCTFLNAWERHLDRPFRRTSDDPANPVAEILHSQVEEFAGSLRRGRMYRPYFTVETDDER